MKEGLRNTVTYDLNASQTNCECVFLLRRLSQLPGTLEVRANFGPVIDPDSGSQHHSSPCVMNLPTFNKDHKFYTPSFLLPQDMTKLKAGDSQILTTHYRKVEQILDEKDQLLVPKPSKANRFCLICKQNYDDYLTHIQYPSHNRLLKSSPFYKDIQQLCIRLNPSPTLQKNKKITKQRKKKQNSKLNNVESKASIQKSSQSLSTGMQTLQSGQSDSPLGAKC